MDVHRLKLELFERGMSQHQLAQRIGCTDTLLSGICRGKREPRLNVFKAICRELNLDPRELW